jgi:hypothetical protein
MKVYSVTQVDWSQGESCTTIHLTKQAALNEIKDEIFEPRFEECYEDDLLSDFTDQCLAAVEKHGHYEHGGWCVSLVSHEIDIGLPDDLRRLFTSAKSTLPDVCEGLDFQAPYVTRDGQVFTLLASVGLDEGQCGVKAGKYRGYEGAIAPDGTTKWGGEMHFDDRFPDEVDGAADFFTCMMVDAADHFGGDS